MTNDIKVITLCGSTKFIKEFKQVEVKLTLKGFVVLRPVFFEENTDIKPSQKERELLGKIHFKKIELSDEILVIDKDGYLGESTEKEIEYAKQQGKVVRYYSDGLD